MFLGCETYQRTSQLVKNAVTPTELEGMTATVRPRVPATVLVLVLCTWLLSASNIGIATASASTQSTSSYASRLAQLINNARAQNGVRALTLASGTSSVAASWTSHLASQRSLSHNPHLFSDVEQH